MTRAPFPALRAILALFAAVASIGAAAAPAALYGTYRMQGNGRVSARPVLSRTFELRADAALKAGPSPGVVVVRVAAEGAVCEIEAALDGAGALAFRPGQTCSADIRSPDTRARVDARLRSGTGRVGGGELSMELAWDLSGRVSFRAVKRSDLGGGDASLPDLWLPEVPVRGDAQGSATGHLDASKSAEPVRIP